MFKSITILAAFGTFGMTPIMASAPTPFEAELTRLDSPVQSTQLQMSYFALSTDGGHVHAEVAPNADYAIKLKTKGGLHIRIGF